MFYIDVVAWVMHACYLVKLMVMYMNNTNLFLEKKSSI